MDKKFIRLAFFSALLIGVALTIACSGDIDDLLVNYPVLTEPEASYYLDATGGDDANDGISPETAWKTLEKLNGANFQSGNKVFLKRGEKWEGQLSPKGSGTDTTPIVLGAYGEGARPIIDGKGEVVAAVYLTNQSNWEIQDLELTNYAEDRGTTYRCGILVENNNTATVSNIKIKDNYVREVSGSFRYQGNFHPQQYGGIAVNVIGETPTDKLTNILIEGNVVEKAGRTGIVVWDHLFTGDADASTGVVIRGNKVKDIDSDGILTYGCNGALIEYNVADGCGSYREEGEFNGSAGIWSTRGKNCIIQYNEAFNTRKLEGNGDGTGFDLDMDAINCIVQYNYSHDNEGGFMLLVDGSNSSGSIVRYNISQNDKTRVFLIGGGVTPRAQIYNNTIYVGENLNTNIIEHSWDDGGDINASWTFKNNVIYNLGSGEYHIPGSGGVFQGNVYYGNHPASEPSEVGKLIIDPLFINVGSGALGLESLDGYKLQETSPIVNAGTMVTNNGGLDFWKNVVSASGRATPGAFEPNGTIVGDIDFIDPMGTLDLISFKTDNWQVAWVADPSTFDGDETAIARTDDADGIIVYDKLGIKSFRITIYAYAGVVLDHLQIYGSTIGGDLSNFTPIPVGYDDVATSDGWRKITIYPNITLPENVNHLGVRIAGGVGANWAVQIGEVSITHKAE